MGTYLGGRLVHGADHGIHLKLCDILSIRSLAVAGLFKVSFNSKALDRLYVAPRVAR